MNDFINSKKLDLSSLLHSQEIRLSHEKQAFNIQHFDYYFFPTQEEQEENRYAAPVTEQQDFSVRIDSTSFTLTSA